MYTREQWARAMLAETGNHTPDISIVEFIVGWTVFETASGVIPARYNLLNTTQREPGSTDFNTVGVQNFTSFQQGTKTNAKVLANGYYPLLWRAISQNLAPFFVHINQLAENELSTWGTGPHGYMFVEVGKSHMGDMFPGSTGNSSYMIVTGDTLNGIAKKFQVSEQWLFSINQATLDTAAKNHGHPNSNNGNLIFPGTVIQV